jgi:DNA polymerase V
MIALVDCNNFYASCERTFRPDLADTPIVVLSNNDGCVIARCNLAKKMGIPMGAPEFKYRVEFKRQGISVFSSNYALYGDMSSRVMSILGDMAPGIEVYSIDECFLDLKGISPENLESLAVEMKERVERWTGIPISIGIGKTKALAKAANRYAKKNKHIIPEGIYIIDSESKRKNVLEWLPLPDVWGIGRQQFKKLDRLGIKNAYMLSKLDEQFVKKKFTVVGLRLVKELKGISSIEWEFEPPDKKATAVTRSFAKALYDIEPILENISIYASVCGEKLRAQQSDCLMLQVFLRTSRFKNPLEQLYVQRIVKMPYPTNSSIDLSDMAQKVMRTLYKPGFGYAKAGVVAMMLTPTENRQKNLFANEDPRHKAIMAAMDKHNQRDRRDLIRIAANGTGRRWRMKQELLSPRYTTRLSDIIKVKATA